MRVYTTMMQYRWALCRSEHSRLVAAVADCGLLLKCSTRHRPHAARAEVINLTIFNGPLTVFEPERLWPVFFFSAPFNASTVQLFTSPKVKC
jgi:hypothetical protein